MPHLQDAELLARQIPQHRHVKLAHRCAPSPPRTWQAQLLWRIIRAPRNNPIQDVNRYGSARRTAQVPVSTDIQAVFLV